MLIKGDKWLKTAAVDVYCYTLFFKVGFISAFKRRNLRRWLEKLFFCLCFYWLLNNHYGLSSTVIYPDSYTCSVKPTYPQDPTRHLVCRWMCPHQASGGPAASRCVSRSQTSNHTSARQRGTNAHRCSRCSSRCPGGCTGSNLTHSPVRWCGTWHRSARPHWRESNRE